MGSVKLGQQLERKLRAEGRNPVVIPVGGSNSLGTWGYLEAMAEIEQQVGPDRFTDIAMVGFLTPHMALENNDRKAFANDQKVAHGAVLRCPLKAYGKIAVGTQSEYLLSTQNCISLSSLWLWKDCSWMHADRSVQIMWKMGQLKHPARKCFGSWSLQPDSCLHAIHSTCEHVAS